MSKIYQHKYLSDSKQHMTVASSSEISGAVCNFLEKTVCRLNNNFSSYPSVFATSLTTDTVIIGNCSSNKAAGKEDNSQAQSYNYYHSFIISNNDIANLINKDPYFLQMIDFEASMPQKGKPIADSIAKLPLNQQPVNSRKISGTMLQNTFCSLMDIIAKSEMRYISINEPFSPFEIIGLAYSVLPLHSALAFSYVTYTADIPNVKYNICFVDNAMIEHIRPQYRMTASGLFSGDQPISITAYPRLSTLIDQSSADISALKRFYMFAYDFINIINKYSNNKLDPLDPKLYETLLCIYTYSTRLLSVSRNNLPEDIIAALNFMDELLDAIPQAKEEINILVPTTPKDENIVTITPTTNKSKRAERETALKILSLITTTPDKIDDFTDVKSLVMREAQMGTFSLTLFQKVLREALKSFDFSALDDNQLIMASYAVSLAFETVDYRIYGSNCISYAPYDYKAMFEFISNINDNKRLFYKKMVSLHKHFSPLFIEACSDYKPSKVRKKEKENIKAEKQAAKAAQIQEAQSKANDNIEVDPIENDDEAADDIYSYDYDPNVSYDYDMDDDNTDDIDNDSYGYEDYDSYSDSNIEDEYLNID